jgi:hypothetical protein
MATHAIERPGRFLSVTTFMRDGAPAITWGPMR